MPPTSSSSPPHASEVPRERDVGIGALAIALIGGLGLLGLARAVLLPGALQGVSPLNPVGGTLGALMLVSAPVAVGIWLGHTRTAAAAAAGLLGAGAAWLFTAPLLFAPAAGALLVDELVALQAAGLPATEASGALVDALRACVHSSAIGLPVALLLGGGLAWSGAALSPLEGVRSSVTDPLSRSLAALMSVAGAGVLGLYVLIELPGTPAAIAAPLSFGLAARPIATLALFGGPPLGVAIAAGMGWQALRRTALRPELCPISLGAWSFVALGWSVGLPTSLFVTAAAGLLPLVEPTLAHLAIVPETWNAMYDHTLVGMVVGLLTALVSTTGAVLLTPERGPAQPRPDRWTHFR